VSTVTTPADLALFMNVTLDDDRAQQMLDIIEGFALAVISPLPPAAKGVILTAAARAYPNPSGTAAQSTAGSSTSWGWHGSGGTYLTRTELRMLQRMAGIGGGAFSVNVAPNAGKHYRDPLRPATLDDAETFALDQDLP
jgi:hypothetical protein